MYGIVPKWDNPITGTIGSRGADVKQGRGHGRIVELLQLVIASSVMTNERIARSLGLNVVDLTGSRRSSSAADISPMTAGDEVSLS